MPSWADWSPWWRRSRRPGVVPDVAHLWVGTGRLALEGERGNEGAGLLHTSVIDHAHTGGQWGDEVAAGRALAQCAVARASPKVISICMTFSFETLSVGEGGFRSPVWSGGVGCRAHIHPPPPAPGGLLRPFGWRSCPDQP